MKSTVFLSHAGVDSPRVSPIASALQDEGLRVRLDREELRVGDSFLSFMEDALKTSDYCFLLWSRAASESKWVSAEWEAAFHRAVMESQNFLIVGCIEEFPVPELLRPRLRVDLYPEIDSGIKKLVEMCRNDERAKSEGLRPVVAPKVELDDEFGDKTVYVTSETFGKTFPMKIVMNTPVAMIIQQIQTKLGLPLQLDVEGRIGCRFKYSLIHDDTALRSKDSLISQNVRPEALLWLQTEMEPFSSTAPVSGKIENVTFRGTSGDEVTQAARRHFLTAVSRVGLGY